MSGKIQLLYGDQVLPAAIVDYCVRNREFLRPFEPVHSPEYYTVAHWERELIRQEPETRPGSGVYFYICEAGNAERIIGMISLTNIVMGPFRSAFLSYKLDKDLLNRGYMTEAVSLVTEYAFTRLGLHRIEANVMPRNLPSLRVLEKCGYQQEGIARKYLKINGVWEDHIHMVRLNEAE